jgi:hypothetical protein
MSGGPTSGTATAPKSVTTVGNVSVPSNLSGSSPNATVAASEPVDVFAVETGDAVVSDATAIPPVATDPSESSVVTGLNQPNDPQSLTIAPTTLET